NEMCLLAAAIEACFRPDKLNYELLGNQVPHLHWHLFPRSRRDPHALKPVWLAIDRAEHNANERTRLQGGPLDRAAPASRLRGRLTEMAAPTSCLDLCESALAAAAWPYGKQTTLPTCCGRLPANGPLSWSKSRLPAIRCAMSPCQLSADKGRS